MRHIRQLWVVLLAFLCLPEFQCSTAFIQRLSTLEPQCPEKCSCTTRLKKVVCVGQRLRKVPNDIPQSVINLYLSHNLFTEIGHGAFQNLNSLNTLYLGHNHIAKIADGAFMGLDRLIVLDLQSNELRTLTPEAFRGLNSLHKLHLTDNQLSRVPDIRHARSVDLLRLDNNYLESAHIPDGFRNLTRLHTIVLSNNPNLTQINDGDFSALNHSTIRKIQVSRCSLNHIGKNMYNFPHLQSLSLSYNARWNETFLRGMLSLLANYCLELRSLDLSGLLSLRSLPADIFSSLASVPLKSLKLAHTPNVDFIVKKTFQYLPALRFLDLSYSDFRIIQDDMSEMKQLYLLKLSNNKRLKLIPTLNLPTLQVLDISWCNFIGQLKPKIFSGLPALSRLTVRGCGIHGIYREAFVGLKQLQTLDLSQNILGKWSLPTTVFDPLTSLTTLDLSGNLLEDIPRERHLFHSLKTLAVLDLSDNHCSVISQDIFSRLTSLVSLDLSGNNLGGGVINATSGGKLFRALGTLQTVSFTRNNIKDLPKGLFDNLLSLRMVDLSRNQLSGWNGSAFGASTKLSLLDFSANKIITIPQSSIVPLAPQVKLKLGANPFCCWCDLIWFRNWIKDNSITDRNLPGLTSYRCSSPVSMRNKQLLDFDPQSIAKQCSPPPWIIITASVSSGVAVVIVIIVVLCYKYRWPIRLKVYRIRKLMRGEPGYARLDDATEDVFDVYVSYGPSPADEDWVTWTLMPVIDTRERERRMRPLQDEPAAGETHETPEVFRTVAAYWEKRDMYPGTSEIGAIAEAINRSRKVLLIVSAEYLNDGRRDFEMRLAVDKSCRARRQLADIAIVLLDHAAGVNLPPALHSKLEEALEWTPDDANGQQLFWQKLEDFLNSDVPLQPLPTA